MIHVLHIGKTAGTALKHALQPCADKFKFHPHEVSLQDIARGEKVVFSLRNPINRFFSGFYSRLRKGAPRYSSSWSPGEEKAFSIFQSPESLLRAASQPSHAEYLNAHRALLEIEHIRDRFSKWLISIDYLRSRTADIAHVSFVETFEEDFRVLKNKLSLPDGLRLPDSPIESHSNPPYKVNLSDPGSEICLNNLLFEDFEFYDFCRHER